MDVFILLAAGLLGAAFLASQSDSARVAPLWQIIFGVGSGGLAYVVLRGLGGLPEDANIGAFLFLGAIGGLAGAAGILLFYLMRWLVRQN